MSHFTLWMFGLFCGVLLAKYAFEPEITKLREAVPCEYFHGQAYVPARCAR